MKNTRHIPPPALSLSKVYCRSAGQEIKQKLSRERLGKDTIWQRVDRLALPQPVVGRSPHFPALVLLPRENPLSEKKRATAPHIRVFHEEHRLEAFGVLATALTSQRVRPP